MAHIRRVPLEIFPHHLRGRAAQIGERARHHLLRAHRFLVQDDILASDESTAVENTRGDSVRAKVLVRSQAVVKKTTLAMLAIHRSE
jgi:hypothetical protein